MLGSPAGGSDQSCSDGRSLRPEVGLISATRISNPIVYASSALTLRQEGRKFVAIAIIRSRDDRLAWITESLNTGSLYPSNYGSSNRASASGCTDLLGSDLEWPEMSSRVSL